MGLEALTDSIMTHEDDVLSSDVCRDELEHFKNRRPQFGDALARLQSAPQDALCRELEVTPEKRAAQIAFFGLAHQAAADFFDIALLATHGYGIGALKPLCPLFERIVSALYLIENPAKVEDFTAYIDIDAWRVITNAKRVGVDPVAFMGKEQFAEAEKAFKNAAAWSPYASDERSAAVAKLRRMDRP